MTPFTLAWAAEQLGVEVLDSPTTSIHGVCTDTRSTPRHSLFFALRGERSDGHAFVERAFETGAAAAVTSRGVSTSERPLIVVDDPITALGDLAAAYRSQFHLPVVGITGSVGKTSTKEMVAAVLSAAFRTLASAGNFNTEIGLPLTLFELEPHHRAAVLEMGMRGAGQIARLAEIARPTIGVITNIGYAHIELLGSQENIAAAKAELLAGLSPGGIAILPTEPAIVQLNAQRFGLNRPNNIPNEIDEARMNEINRRLFSILSSHVPPGCRIITYGRGGHVAIVRPDSNDRADSNDGPIPSSFVNALSPEPGRAGVVRAALEMSVSGEHHYRNAEAALATAWAIGLPLGPACAALKSWSGAAGRLATRYAADRDITVLDDCYNAGPESMAAALSSLAESPAGHRVAVLGDMRELGDYSAAAHRIVGARAAEANLRALITVGELARGIAREVMSGSDRCSGVKPLLYEFADASEASASITSIVRPGDSVLIKGSRALEMEHIVAALIGEAAPHSHG